MCGTDASPHDTNPNLDRILDTGLGYFESPSKTSWCSSSLNHVVCQPDQGITYVHWMIACSSLVQVTIVEERLSSFVALDIIRLTCVMINISMMV